MEKEKCAATLVIKDAASMSKRGKASIAAWLRQQARYLVRGGDKYAKTYRARYLYRQIACAISTEGGAP